MTAEEKQGLRLLIDQAVRATLPPTCGRCGKPFTPNDGGSRKRYCTEKCQKLEAHRRYRQRRMGDPVFRERVNVRKRRSQQRRRARA